MGARLVAAALLAALIGVGAAAQTARFTVTQEVVNPDVAPFTATLGDLDRAMALVSESFEPTVFRNQFTAAANAANTVEASPSEISVWSTLREGALDGADVDVYRISNGVFARVRRDRIAPGGFRASGWAGNMPGGRLLPGDADRFTLALPEWWRPDAPLWLSVRAVDAEGRLSPTPPAVAARSSAAPRRLEPQNALVDGAVTEGLDGPGTAALSAPTALAAQAQADGSISLRWRPAPGAAGHVVLLSETPPESHRGYGVDLEGGTGQPAIRAGDLVVISKTVATPRREALFRDRIWNAGADTWTLRRASMDFWPGEDPLRDWRLAHHEPGTPVEEPGETYLSMTLGRRAEATIGYYNHAGAGQDHYHVLEPRAYRMEAWVRADRAARVAFRFTGPYQTAIRPKIFDVGPQWRRIQTTVTPPRTLDGTHVGRMELQFVGEGRFDVDNFRVWRADGVFMQPAPESMDRLRRSGMAALRTHDLIKTGRRTYDLGQLTNPGGVTSMGRGATLPQQLRLIAEARARPWLQIEPHLSPEEWLGLIEYLAAPFDPALHDAASRPWAAKRHAQGRAAPWTDAFDEILFEVGNETWNSLFRPWVFPGMPDAATGVPYSGGAVLGLYTEHVLRLFRSSPYWSDALKDKFRVVVGGHPGSMSFTAHAARFTPSADYVTLAAYNGGWDEGEAPVAPTPTGFHSILTQTPQVIEPRAKALAALLKDARAHGSRAAPGSYEAGPGYVLNGLNGARVTPEQVAAQERAMKSQAAGVATLDAFLAMAARGYSIQNYFTFGAGRYWTSHATWSRGGAEHPSWMLLSLFNRIGTGAMLATRTVATPVDDLEAGANRQARQGAPLIAVHATRDGDRLTVFVLSRRIPKGGDPGLTPIEIALPIVSAERVTGRFMDGPLDAHTAGGGRGVAIRTVDLPPPDDPSVIELDADMGLGKRGLPPGSAAVYVFEGVRWRAQDTN